MFCLKCGKEIKDNAKFCNFCGEIIKKNAVSASVPNGNSQANPVKTTNNSFFKSPRIEISKRKTVNKVSALEPIAQKRMVIFALVALICILLANGWSIFSQHQTIQNSLGIVKESNFFELRLNNGTYIYSYGRLFVECGKEILISLFFFVVCLTAKKCSSIVTGLPSAFSLAFTIVWAIVLTMASKMGTLHQIYPNLLSSSIVEIIPEIIFIALYLLSVKGKIYNSLLAKMLTLLIGCIPVVLSFISLVEYFMRIDVSMTNALGTTYIAMSLVASVFSFLAVIFVKMAMFVYVCNTRRKIEEEQAITN